MPGSKYMILRIKDQKNAQNEAAVPAIFAGHQANIAL
jgi:hypothetical protein